MAKRNSSGLLLGALIGSLIGSTGTLLVLKKLGKLEEKKLAEREAEHIEEVKRYYEAKIKEAKNKVNEEKKNTETAEKVIAEVKNDIKTLERPNKSRISYEGLDVKDEDPTPAFDYSKISKDKYKELQKEYEREEILEEYDEHPHQITKGCYENEPGFHKMELMYYEQNGIFTYMDDTICNTVTEEVIGADNLSLFGTDDASIDGLSGMYDLYLRSSKIMTDFHLIYNGTEDYYKVINNDDDED